MPHNYSGSRTKSSRRKVADSFAPPPEQRDWGEGVETVSKGDEKRRWASNVRQAEQALRGPAGLPS